MIGEAGEQVSQEKQSRPPQHLYVALNVNSFPMFFRNKGIKVSSTQDMHSPRLTSDWDTARVYADIHSASNPFCLAEITGRILERQRIAKRELPENLRTDRRAQTEYSGDDEISWSEVERMFVTPQALDRIQAAYREATGVTKWDDVQRRVVVIDDPKTEQGLRKLRKLIDPYGLLK